MDAGQNFAIAKQKFEHQIQMNQKALADKKAALAKIELDIKESDKKIADSKTLIVSTEMKIKSDQIEERKLQNELRKLEQESLEFHRQIEQLASDSKEHLNGMGMNVPRHF